jgi:hypothetical protein
MTKSRSRRPAAPRGALWAVFLGAAWLAAIPLPAAAQGKYGALAFQKDTRAYGYSFDQPTRIAAENRALAECGKGCVSILWFANGCGALAASQQRYGAGSAPTRDHAQKLAHERCGKGCRTLVTTCSPKK